ncbi:hypothetical protein GCM10010168_46930 [Actinoplanes ianthinogenes]|uniref:Uncharacterized protein n=1 Tax=Actinoplanes ianthinogenes TaxID=122358 RepID=A0ABN6C7C8_9ACTN|nr:hypothetical protein Aiant_16650 [Actinoplanes ianthinogenes]GGR23553.1 hypothetical protein GCM10010168_46930 [Actinoplanes ianthinogenes]
MVPPGLVHGRQRVAERRPAGAQLGDDLRVVVETGDRVPGGDRGAGEGESGAVLPDDGDAVAVPGGLGRGGDGSTPCERSDEKEP